VENQRCVGSKIPRSPSALQELASRNIGFVLQSEVLNPDPVSKTAPGKCDEVSGLRKSCNGIPLAVHFSCKMILTDLASHILPKERCAGPKRRQKLFRFAAFLFAFLNACRENESLPGARVLTCSGTGCGFARALSAAAVSA
jgi:hypothetical protein